MAQLVRLLLLVSALAVRVLCRGSAKTPARALFMAILRASPHEGARDVAGADFDRMWASAGRVIAAETADQDDYVTDTHLAPRFAATGQTTVCSPPVRRATLIRAAVILAGGGAEVMLQAAWRRIHKASSRDSS